MYLRRCWRFNLFWIFSHNLPYVFIHANVTHFDVILLPRDSKYIKIVHITLLLQIKFAENPIKLGARTTNWSPLGTKHIDIVTWRFLHKHVKLSSYNFLYLDFLKSRTTRPPKLTPLVSTIMEVLHFPRSLSLSCSISLYLSDYLLVAFWELCLAFVM